MPKKTLFIALAVLAISLVAATAAFALDWSPIQRMGWGGDWDQWPNAAADRNGRLYVVWSTYPYDRSVWFNSYDGTQWGSPRRISESSFNSWWPDLFVDGLGNVHVVWQGTGYHMYYRRFDGSSWSSPTGTSLVGGYPSVAVGSSGQVIIANTSTNQDIAYVVGDGATWSPRMLTGESGRAHLSADKDGVVYLAYSDRASGGKIAYRTWTGSSWSDETVLDSSCGLVNMFHSETGNADILCLDDVVYQLHYDGSAWGGPTIVSSGGGWKNAFGAPNGVLLVIWTQRPSDGETREDAFIRVWTGSAWLDAENVSNTEWRSIWPAVGLTSNNKILAIWSENDYADWAFTLNAREALLILNEPPVAVIQMPPSVPEGEAVQLDASLSSDPDGDIVLYEWDLDNDGLYDDASGTTTQVVFNDNGEYLVGLRVTDGHGEFDTDIGQVTVLNVPPVITSISPPSSPSPVGEMVDVGAAFMDPGQDTWTAAWDWGNGESSQGELTGLSVHGSHTYSIPGTYTITLTVQDDDGGVGAGIAHVTVVNVPPLVDIPTVSPAPSREGDSVVAHATFHDTGVDNEPFTCAVDYGDGSGDLAAAVDGYTCGGPTHAYETFGSYTVTIRVTDTYGGTGSNAISHAVIFDWSGFFPPVDNPPNSNQVNAGRTIPIKFSLGGDKGLAIFAAGHPQSQLVACDTGVAMGDLQTAETPGGSSLSYDASTETYHYGWKTEKAWAGSCRRMTLLLVDGTEHYAVFGFK